MKRTLFVLAVALILTYSSLIVSEKEITLTQTNESGIYKKGQKISLFAIPVNKKGDSLRVRVLKNSNLVNKKKSIIADKDNLLLFEGSLRESCSVIIEVRSNMGYSSIGLLVDPKNLKPDNTSKRL